MTHQLLKSIGNILKESKLDENYVFFGIYYEHKTNRGGGQIYEDSNLILAIKKLNKDPIDANENELMEYNIELENLTDFFKRNSDKFQVYEISYEEDFNPIIEGNYNRYRVYEKIDR